MIIAFIFFIISFIIFIIPATAVVYHLYKFGMAKDMTRPMLIAFSLVAFLLIITSVLFMAITDWPETLAALPIDFTIFE